jgi:hypothetical protein
VPSDGHWLTHGWRHFQSAESRQKAVQLREGEFLDPVIFAADHIGLLVLKQTALPVRLKAVLEAKQTAGVSEGMCSDLLRSTFLPTYPIAEAVHRAPADERSLLGEPHKAPSSYRLYRNSTLDHSLNFPIT